MTQSDPKKTRDVSLRSGSRNAVPTRVRRANARPADDNSLATFRDGPEMPSVRGASSRVLDRYDKRPLAERKNVGDANGGQAAPAELGSRLLGESVRRALVAALHVWLRCERGG